MNEIFSSLIRGFEFKILRILRTIGSIFPFDELYECESELIE